MKDIMQGGYLAIAYDFNKEPPQKSCVTVCNFNIRGLIIIELFVEFSVVMMFNYQDASCASFQTKITHQSVYLTIF